MTNHSHLSLFKAVVLLAALAPAVLLSQVKIKERVEVQPSIKKTARLVDLTYFEGTISPNNSHQLFNVVRSCEVEATGTFSGPGTSIMIIMSTGENLTNNTATRKIYCTSTLGFELWTWTTAGIVVESITGSISGGSATYSISGYQSFPHPMNVPFTASVTFSASYCADFDLAGITLSLNSGTAIECGGALPVRINAFDAGGRIFCDQSNTQVTASLSAGGSYVFLQSASQSGSSITFPLSEGAFSVVLDPSLGLLPNGADTAHVSVQASVAQATTDITLRCVYEPPTVRIEFPSSTSPPVYVSAGDQPIVVFTETHTPPNGALEPQISWSPSNSIDTKDYFAQLQDSIPLSIPVSVTATNLIGTATDNGMLVLMKRKDVDRFIVTVTPDTIAVGDFVFVSAKAVDADGNEVMLDDNTTVNLAANPSDAGVFYPSDVVTYGELKSGYVVFVSVGTEPVSPQDVIISVSDAERSGTGKVVITSPPCVVVQMSAARIGPGEQSEVKIWALEWDGRLKPYSEGQMFEVSMNVDQSVGRLRSGWGEEGTVLWGPEPFVFIAADSLAADSAVVEIQVFASSGGVVSSVRDEDSEELRAAQKAAVAKLERILSVQTADADGMRTAKKTAGVSTAQSDRGSGSGPFPALHAGRKERAVLNGEMCDPTAEVVVGQARIPTTIDLNVDPQEVNEEVPATLVATIFDKDRQPFASGDLNASVMFRLGEEATGIGAIGTAGGGLDLSVQYDKAVDRSTKAFFGRHGGRFPLRISVSAESSPISAVYDEITVLGPRTTGLIYSQLDGDWADSSYDGKGHGIVKNNGCALTCMAMVARALGLDTDPKRLNEKMKSLGVRGFTDSGGVMWKAIKEYETLHNLQFTRDGNGYSSKTISSATPVQNQDTILRQWLDDGWIVVAQVKNPYHDEYPVKPLTKVSAHWVVVTGKAGNTYSIIDPANPLKPNIRGTTTLSQYDGKVYALRGYKP